MSHFLFITTLPWYLIPSLYGWGNWCLGKLNNMAECPWVVNVRTQALSPATVPLPHPERQAEQQHTWQLWKERQRSCRVGTSCPSLNHWRAPLTFLAGYLAGQAAKAMTVAVATAEISEQTLATTVTLDSTISHEDRTDSERLDKAQVQFSSVQFRRSVVPNSLRPHGPQHARPPWRAAPFWPWFITGGQEKAVIQGSNIM